MVPIVPIVPIGTSTHQPQVFIILTDPLVPEILSDLAADWNTFLPLKYSMVA
jgi:hypothetical protein